MLWFGNPVFFLPQFLRRLSGGEDSGSAWGLTDMAYKHTQVGYLIIVALLASALSVGIILSQADYGPGLFIVMFFVLFVIGSFSLLTVTIDKHCLRVKFGFGIFRKNFMLRKIISVRIVRNRWYHGWGIRLSLRPRMWIFNVSGLDAVEIKIQNGKVYRIGTDEPKKLEYAIMQAIL